MNEKRLREIEARKQAIRSLLESGEDCDLDALESEIRDLDAEKSKIEQRARMVADLPVKPEPNDTRTGPHVQVTSDPADRPFRSIGEQLIAVVRASRNPQDVDPRLLRVQEEYRKEMRATGMSEAVPADGGFAVQQDFQTAILQKVHEVGIVARAARPGAIQIGPNSNGVKINAIDESSRADGSRWGGIRGYWLNEATAPTKSKPKLRRMSLDLEKVGALVYLTEELIQDAAALQSLVMGGVPDELAFQLDDAIINGDGAGKPLGILNSGALVSVAKETGQAAATIVAENIVKMWARCWAPSRRRATWYINQDIEPQLLTMSLAVGTGGAPIFVPPGGLSASPFGTLLGRPIEPIEHCATLGTVGDIILADFSEYQLIEKGGVQSATSIHVKFEEGETALRFILRTNGQPKWDKPLTPFKGTNTLSPFVALATRA